MSHESIYVACSLGLEHALAEELRALGCSSYSVERGGVEAQAPAGHFALLNRKSRIANRVLLRVGTVRSPNALSSLRWAPFISKKTRVWVESSGGHAAPWIAAARSVWTMAASAKEAEVTVFLRLLEGHATLSVDTTGELLSFRGYRQEMGRAPLRETIAAGLLQLAGYDGTMPLWDIMCGSGTIVIEAAERALGLEPGRNRHFAFEQFASAPSTLPHDARSERSERGPLILGTDLNSGALGTARRNAKRAGVFERITLERLDATKIKARTQEPGIVVANLPYGTRVGEKSELQSLYRNVGSALKRELRGWRYAFLLERGAEWLELEIAERHAISNGGISCELVTGAIG